MSAGDWSFLLWLMAAVVALLSSHLFVAWIRRAQGLVHARDRLGPALRAAVSLAVGLSSAMVLALGAEGFPFALGFRWLALPLLVGLGSFMCLPAAWWLTRRQSLPVLMGAGTLVAAASLAVQLGWLQAAGFRPGLRWEPALAGGAALMALVGYTAAMWLAYSDGSGHGARRTLWRLGAATLMLLTMVASQEVLLTAAGLEAQMGSVYQHEMPATWLALGAGAVVPTAMALLVLDLVLRNHGERRRRHSRTSPFGVEPDLLQRRKHRRKHRTL